MTFFPPPKFVQFEMWKNIVEPKRQQRMRMRIARRKTKAPKNTHTHVEHLLLFHCNNGCSNVSQCYVYTSEKTQSGWHHSETFLHPFIAVYTTTML